MVSLGDCTQQGPDPAFVRNPDRLDYLLHDHKVLVLAPNHFHPDRSLIFFPECQRSDFVTTDGWEPALRTAVGLDEPISVLSRRYRCPNTSAHGKMAGRRAHGCCHQYCHCRHCARHLLPPSATFCHLPFAARRPLNACLLLRAESGKDARFNAAHPDVQQRLPDDVRIRISIIFTHK